MGREYKIKLQVRDKQRLESFLERLSTEFEEFGKEVIIALEEDGFYFCDTLYGDPSVTSKLFYIVVEKALSGNEEIVIYEP